jgi:nitroreductase
MNCESTVVEEMEDRPSVLPEMQPDGAPLKPLPQVLLERRATSHFKPDQVPDEYLDAILRLGAQAPSGYNLQPWRFIVVRDAVNRQRLRKAAMDQEKVSEAPVVLIAVGMKEASEHLEDVLCEGVRRGIGKPEAVDQMASSARQLLETLPAEVWVNRHVMIAVTTMMLAAEAYGFDTAPMEGFDAETVKHEFNIPDEAEVVALLAIGRARQPDKIYPGRFPLERIVFNEHFGAPWSSGSGE